jgi:CRP/FNR family transcriptional regulator, cyclic AMP receptor protein
MPAFDQLPLFRQLTPEELMDILRMAAVLKVKPGQVLCTEGEPADAMFVLESGKVRIQKRTLQGQPEELGTRGAGQVVGELALLDGLPRSATVIAVEAGTVYRVARSDFLLLRNHLHPAAYKVIRNLARELCGLLREQAERLEAFYAEPERSLKEMERRQRDLTAQVL